MTPFKTNALKYNLDRKAIAEKYDVFLVKKDAKRFNHGTMCLDVPLMEKRVCAVRFDCENTFYVLMDKGDGNKTLLLNALKQTDEIDKICIPPVRISDVNDRTLIQLLLNTLGTSSNERLRINNLTGHLYCYKSDWLKKNAKEGFIEQVSCLEILVTKNLCLNISVRTFTSGKCKDQIIFSPKHPYESYPKYVLSRFQTMARKPKDSTEEEFIQRQKFHNKYNIPFLNIGKEKESFESSKMGVVADIVQRFNDRFGNLAHLDFDEIFEYKSLERTRACINEDKTVKSAALEGKSIRIIDLVKENSEEFCTKAQEVVEKLCEIKPTIGVNKSKDGLNICVVLEKEKYKDIEDPYGKNYDATVQHITIGGNFKNKSAQLKSVLNELVIKHDIRKKRLSLYDWTKTSFQNDVSFGMKFDLDDENEKQIYCFVTIHPSGAFDFVKKDPTDLFDYDDYTKCTEIFAGNDDVCGIVMNHKREINVIRNTDWFTIPEIFKIREEYEKERIHEFRSKVGREEFLPGVTDIKMFEKNGSIYYFVGTVGLGMQASVSNAANIRRIEPLDDAPMFFEQLLPLMNVDFVHNERLTVRPFPFKYLTEWARMNFDLKE